jgi:hypothetical protein
MPLAMIATAAPPWLAQLSQLPWFQSCRSQSHSQQQFSQSDEVPPVSRLDHVTARPFETFTVDSAFTDAELSLFSRFVAERRGAGATTPFTHSPFANGKISDAGNITRLMYERLAPHLPAVYVDAAGARWEFVGAAPVVMFADIAPGHLFGLHTDTGAVYDAERCVYSKFTVLTFLNADFVGGCTEFYTDRFEATHTVSPRANRTLVFDIDLYHRGAAVLSGAPKRWVGTELVCRRL